jgi:hypothetical protein
MPLNTKQDWRNYFKAMGVKASGSKISKAELKRLMTARVYLTEDLPEVAAFIKELLEEKWKTVEQEYELYGDDEAEAIEYKSRDGFIPHTQGGFEIKGFTDSNMLMGSGKLPSHAASAKEIEDMHEQGLKDALDMFWEKYGEEVEKLGLTKEQTDYHSLYEKDAGELAETLSEYESENNSGELASIMFRMGVYYYEPKGEGDSHSLYVFSEINSEAPYHRSKYGKVPFTKELEFKDLNDLKPKLKAALDQAVDSLL